MSKDPAYSITITIYNNMEHIVDENIDNINLKLTSLKTTDKHFRNACMSIFELASSAYAFWKNADNLRKREILEILFPNLWLDGKTLGFTLRKPFNLFLKEANHIDWLRQTGITRTKKKEINVINHTPILLKILGDSYFKESITCAVAIDSFTGRFGMVA